MLISKIINIKLSFFIGKLKKDKKCKNIWKKDCWFQLKLLWN